METNVRAIKKTFGLMLVQYRPLLVFFKYIVPLSSGDCTPPSSGYLDLTLMT